MKGGRTFRMRIAETSIVDVEVYVSGTTSQDVAERAIRFNYLQMRRDQALLRELHRGLPDVEIQQVVEVVNRE